MAATLISKRILTPVMLVKTIRVSAKGQIALPKELREESGIKEGDTLIAYEDRGRILLQKAHDVAEKAEDDFRDLKKMSELTARKFWSSPEDDVWDTV
jgi:AbrB family looped-hinge helix DNA binding protein